MLIAKSADKWQNQLSKYNGQNHHDARLACSDMDERRMI